MSEKQGSDFQSRLHPPSSSKEEEIERLFNELNKTLDGWVRTTDETYPELTRLREEILRLKEPGADLGQGVLALRFGEFRQYFPWNEGKPPEGDFVYAVALMEAPLPPRPNSSTTEHFGVACCGKAGRAGTWGYINVEKDTKQVIGADLVDLIKAKVGEWVWLRLSTKVEKEGER